MKKTVGFLMEPWNVTMLLSLASFAMLLTRRYRRSMWLFGLVFLWVFLWGNGLVWGRVRECLERMYPPVALDAVPTADAIVLLGGGMTSSSRWDGYPDMAAGADRVWHAARLWKAGKAPIVIPTGVGVDKAELVLLQDFGVPKSAILLETEARNTHENAQFVARMLVERKMGRVLLVTSAVHMRRAELCFRQAGMMIVPCATDYGYSPENKFKLHHLIPTVGGMMANNDVFHEVLGYWGQRLLKR